VYSTLPLINTKIYTGKNLTPRTARDPTAHRESKRDMLVLQIGYTFPNHSATDCVIFFLLSIQDK